MAPWKIFFKRCEKFCTRAKSWPINECTKRLSLRQLWMTGSSVHTYNTATVSRRHFRRECVPRTKFNTYVINVFRESHNWSQRSQKLSSPSFIAHNNPRHHISFVHAWAWATSHHRTSIFFLIYIYIYTYMCGKNVDRIVSSRSPKVNFRTITIVENVFHMRASKITSLVELQ